MKVFTRALHGIRTCEICGGVVISKALGAEAKKTGGIKKRKRRP